MKDLPCNLFYSRVVCYHWFVMTTYVYIYVPSDDLNVMTVSSKIIIAKSSPCFISQRLRINVRLIVTSWVTFDANHCVIYRRKLLYCLIGLR